MEGFEVGERFDTMGLRGNDLRRLYFHDVRVPAENVLGEPGEGFRIAMSILNNGRIGLGTGTVGAAKKLLDLTIDHTTERRQFGAAARRLRARPGEDRLDGLLPLRARVDGLPDLRARRPGRRGLLARVGDLQGRPGPSSSGTPANRALQLAGGEGYMKDRALREDHARHPDLPDLRGRQRRDARVHRAVGHEAGRRAALGARRDRPRRPDRLDRRSSPTTPRAGSSARSGRTGSRWPIRSSPHTPTPSATRSRSSPARDRGADPQAQEGRDLRGSSTRSGSPTRSPTSTRRSRCSAGSPRSSRSDGRRALGPGALHRRHVLHARRRAASAAISQQIEHNDDERMIAIAKLAYKRGEYGYALFGD